MGRLSDAKLTELGQEYKRLAASIAADSELKEAASAKILEQLELRQVATLEVGGMRMTRKAKKMRTFDMEKLKRLLKPAQRKVAIREMAVYSELDNLVKAGVLETRWITVHCGPEDRKAQIIAGVETVEYSKPYVDVTILEPTS